MKLPQFANLFSNQNEPIFSMYFVVQAESHARLHGQHKCFAPQLQLGTLIFPISILFIISKYDSDMAGRCQEHDVPICLMYGKEDPWVTPIWGLKVKRQVPNAPYYEISPAGHCPHDEVPEVFSQILNVHPPFFF